MTIKAPNWCSNAIPTARGWEDPVTGEIWLEGNRIIWTNNGVSITLVVEEWLDGVLISTTTIEIPVGSFGGCFSDCATG